MMYSSLLACLVALCSLLHTMQHCLQRSSAPEGPAADQCWQNEYQNYISVTESAAQPEIEQCKSLTRAPS